MLYDPVLNVTWARNAGLAGSFMTWNQATAWVDSLTLGGFDDWRLPKISVSGGNSPLHASSTIQQACSVQDEASCRDDELGYMYYFNLFPALVSQDFTGDQHSINGQLIENIQQGYWTIPERTQNDAWAVTFGGLGANPCGPGCGGGWYELQPKTFPAFSAWAVRDGDVWDVPEPAVLGLLAWGVLAVGARRRFQSIP